MSPLTSPMHNEPGGRVQLQTLPIQTELEASRKCVPERFIFQEIESRRVTHVAQR